MYLSLASVCSASGISQVRQKNMHGLGAGAGLQWCLCVRPAPFEWFGEPVRVPLSAPHTETVTHQWWLTPFFRKWLASSFAKHAKAFQSSSQNEKIEKSFLSLPPLCLLFLPLPFSYIVQTVTSNTFEWKLGFQPGHAPPIPVLDTCKGGRGEGAASGGDCASAPRAKWRLVCVRHGQFSCIIQVRHT
ncbi:hypothetical protein F5144DRAFT_23855 [Chaetomium tenue]|uniref:Uncharacterized protein n=1 Tax=Chaetomium tenue TaxID=1854479 RepID=A0ACB7PNH0_9PEZI|nr:hypothetical protein F5144DRAFT_23855 [Chaetomium globosum]